MQIPIIFVVTILFLTGLVGSPKIFAQISQERQLLKLFYKKTRKPQPPEKVARHREWERLRQQNEYYKRLKIEGQTQQNNNYGRQLSQIQTQSNPLLPLQQAGPLAESLRQSSKSTRIALTRQKKKQHILKKIQKYRSRNKFRANPPAFRNQLKNR